MFMDFCNLESFILEFILSNLFISGQWLSIIHNVGVYNVFPLIARSIVRFLWGFSNEIVYQSLFFCLVIAIFFIG